MEINIDNWKEFEISKLFEYERGKESAPNQNQDGDCRLLSETQDNNGFVRLVKPTKIIHGHCLTVSVNYASTVFYQEEDFCASVNIIVLRPKAKTTKNQLLFIATILSKKHESYSYTDKVSKNLLMKETIKLPAIYNQETEEYEPNWEYMENFIKEIKEENERKLASLKTLFNPESMRGGELDITDWKEFEIGKLFNIRPTKHHNLTNAMLFDIDGKTPVVVNSSFNNGIGGFTMLEATEEAPKITFSDTTDAEAIFLQTEDFAGYSHVQCLNPIKYEDKWNEKTLMFFQTIFKVKARTMGYNYANKFTRDSASKLILPLPAIYNAEKEEYEPNWNYMENFITNLQEVVKNQLRRLKQENE